MNKIGDIIFALFASLIAAAVGFLALIFTMDATTPSLLFGQAMLSTVAIIGLCAAWIRVILKPEYKKIKLLLLILSFAPLFGFASLYIN